MSTNRKDILLLGGSGLLGRAMLKALSGQHTVTAPGHDQADITNVDELSFLFENGHYDTVINSVAFAAVDRCETNQELAFALNAEGAGNVARACRDHGAGLIHISTDYVFDGQKNVPYHEHDEPSPINVYGESKLEGERLVLDACPEALVVRTAWLFGEGKETFVDRVLNRCREAIGKSDESMRAVDDQVGDLTSCEDFARQIEALLESRLTGILHATSETAVSRFEVAQEVVRLTGSALEVHPCQSSEFPTPAKRPAYSALSNRKIKETGKYVLTNWQESLKKYVQERMKAW